MTTTCSQVETLVTRIQDAFLNTPGLRLTPAQAAQRFALDDASCEAVLEALADSHVLHRLENGAYTRFFPRLAHAA